MKFIIIVTVLSSICFSSYSFPQDAEIIPSDIPKSDTDSGNGDKEPGFVIVSLRPAVSSFDPFSVFRRFFGGSSFLGGSSGDFPVRRPSVPDLFNSNPLFPIVPQSPRFPSFPDMGDLFPDQPVEVPSIDSLPDGYDNSTHEVRVVNGTRIEVNRTLTKSKDDNGIFVEEVHVIRYSPENKNGTFGFSSESSTTESPNDIEDPQGSFSKPQQSENEIPKTETEANDPELSELN